jgi:hypothetical protein
MPLTSRLLTFVESEVMLSYLLPLGSLATITDTAQTRQAVSVCPCAPCSNFGDKCGQRKDGETRTRSLTEE